DYTRPMWATEAHDVQEAARARGIPFGVIYIGNPDSATDEGWTAATEQRMVEYEKEGVRPDHVIFRSWYDKPDHVLPETKPGSFTWLINRYFRPRTKLTLDAATGRVTGTLVDSRGRALVDAPIQLTAVAETGVGTYGAYTLSGTVPAGAKEAV